MPLPDMFNVTQNNPDFWRNLQQWGFATMASGAKPGATTLGALGEGGMAATEAARQNALARSQSEYYGQNTLNKKLENQAAMYDMDLDRRALGQPTATDNLTPMMDIGSPSMTRTPGVGMSPAQSGIETRQSTNNAPLSEDALLRIARGNVGARNVDEAIAALALAKKGSAKEKYLTDYIESNKFAADKARATYPYDVAKAAAGRTSVNVSTGAPFGKKLQEDMASKLTDNFEKLQNIPAQLSALDTASEELKNSKMFMGVGGETLLDMASFANNRLGTNIAKDSVASASTFRSAMFSGIMENLKKMDSNPTQQQQQALKEAIGGLGTDPVAMPKIINLQKEVLANKAVEHNKRVDQAIKSGIEPLYDLHVPVPIFDKKTTKKESTPSPKPGAISFHDLPE